MVRTKCFFQKIKLDKIWIIKTTETIVVVVVVNKYKYKIRKKKMLMVGEIDKMLMLKR